MLVPKHEITGDPRPPAFKVTTSVPASSSFLGAHSLTCTRHTQLSQQGGSPFPKTATRGPGDTVLRPARGQGSCLLSVCSFPAYTFISFLADEKKLAGHPLPKGPPHQGAAVGTTCASPGVNLDPGLWWPVCRLSPVKLLVRTGQDAVPPAAPPCRWAPTGPEARPSSPGYLAPFVPPAPVPPRQGCHVSQIPAASASLTRQPLEPRGACLPGRLNLTWLPERDAPENTSMLIS